MLFRSAGIVTLVFKKLKQPLVLGYVVAGFLVSPHFSFILACVRFPSSTCRVDLSKTDTCPVSPNPKSLGVVDKAKEYGSVRCRVLYGKGSKDSFS